jgi:polysaccharide export outer membrane protein
MRLLSFSCLIVLGFFFASCGSSKKVSYNYLENVQDTIGKGAVRNFEPIIQKKDLLAILVYSNSTKKEISDAVYNPGVTTANGATQGYLVDQDGNIDFPVVGKVHAEGLTKQQLSDTIKAKIGADLQNAAVVIRFLNYRITIVGEVNRQGTFPIPYEKVTIFEALGLAGDIPVTGKRDNVKILRETNGDREIGIINLTSKDVFESPYYYLQQNDVVIVDMKKNKAKQADQGLVTQRITFALGLITSAAFIYNIFK